MTRRDRPGGASQRRGINPETKRENESMNASTDDTTDAEPNDNENDIDPVEVPDTRAGRNFSDGRADDILQLEGWEVETMKRGVTIQATTLQGTPISVEVRE